MIKMDIMIINIKAGKWNWENIISWSSVGSGPDVIQMKDRDAEWRLIS